jgi:cytosine/uracil/thiamine/allantoin permease
VCKFNRADGFSKAVIVTKDGGPLVHGPTNINPKVGSVWSALQALNVVIGLFSSLAVNMPDFARFSKSTRASTSQILLLPLIGTFGALSPIFVTSAYQKIWGSEFFPLAMVYHVCEDPDYAGFDRVRVVPACCHRLI